jgi:thiamine-phosphate pyrophosphorylase
VRIDLPKIYPITDTRISGISIPEQIERLIAGGATLIQIREKHASSREFYESAARAIAIAHSKGSRIIINDRVDIALLLNADGIHLGQDDLPCTQARRILGKNAIIGLSTHTPEQVNEALDLPIDYIAYGPVFTTTTKENPDAVVGLDGLSHARQLAPDFTIVAIGGISESNISGVFKAGADSAALLSDLLSDADQITKKMQALLAS